MAFTQIARDYVAQPDKRIFYTLEVRGFHEENPQWARLSLAREGFRLTNDRAELAASLEFTVPASNAVYFNELNPNNPLALFSEARLTCEMAGESEVLFLGFINEIREEGGVMRCFASDYAQKLARTVCEVELEGETTAELALSPLVVLTGEYDASAFGLDRQQTPGGFSAEGVRRGWKPGDIRVYANGAEVQPDSYRVYPDSGVVRFTQPIPATPSVTGVRCYIEGTSDAAQAVAAALQYPLEKGGIGAQENELDLPSIGTDMNRLEWRRGTGKASEFLAALERKLPRNYRFWHDSERGVFTHALMEQSLLPLHSLSGVASFTRTRSRKSIYTRVIVRGTRTNPPDLAPAASITDLQDGIGEAFEWQGNDRLVGQGSIALIADGDSNHGFGRHNAPYLYQFYDFALIDLGLDAEGLPPRISEIELVAANSYNVNSQKSANTKFSFGYEVLGSIDGVEYERISPDAQVLLAPLQTACIDNLTMPRMRYVKLRVKPAKDGVSNDGDPGLALNEIRIFGDDSFTAEAALQDTDPQGAFYCPDLLEKSTGAGAQVLLVDVGDALPECEAAKLAADLLAESLCYYMSCEVECAADPTVRVGQTVSCAHPVSGGGQSFLVERVELTPARVRISGTDYNAEVLR